MESTAGSPTHGISVAPAAQDVATHFFTVDVEEHFQVSAFEGFIARGDWDRLESRVAANVDRLLALLARHGMQGTFFVLGWVADRHPEVVRAIARGGHEVASHGWDHRRVAEQTASQFRASVRRSKLLLETLSGRAVLGFRAPSFSIVPGCEWALDVLIDEGYRYDSSLFPVRRFGYGYPAGGRDPYWIERPSGRLYEVPPATLRLSGMTLPAAGGAYFRLLPFALVRGALRSCEKRGAPGTFYIHPWEVDPDQPRLAAAALTRVRHYAGLGRTYARLERLVSEFDFTSIADHIPTPEAAVAS